ncbi:MAG TPA: TetR/AcrR family transcriptional regulator [Pseudonocardiaceae bacterium]
MTDTVTDDAAVAARIRDVVRSTGTSQREFADRIGMDPTALSKALRGTRRLRDDELAAIAKVAKVSQRYLRTGIGRGPAPRDTGRIRADALDPDVRRAQILDATARLIARKGFHNVRVADIAAECGTSTGTVHYHFPAKDDALRAALAYYADRFHRQLEAAFATADSTVEKLRRLIEVQLPASDDDVDEWSIWMQAWNEAILDPTQRPGQRVIYTRWRQVVVDLIRACQNEGIGTRADTEALADRFTSMVDGLAIQVLVQTTEMSVSRMRELLLDAFEPHIHIR